MLPKVEQCAARAPTPTLRRAHGGWPSPICAAAAAAASDCAQGTHKHTPILRTLLQSTRYIYLVRDVSAETACAYKKTLAAPINNKYSALSVCVGRLLSEPSLIVRIECVCVLWPHACEYNGVAALFRLGE